MVKHFPKQKCAWKEWDGFRDCWVIHIAQPVFMWDLVFQVIHTTYAGEKTHQNKQKQALTLQIYLFVQYILQRPAWSCPLSHHPT